MSRRCGRVGLFRRPDLASGQGLTGARPRCDSKVGYALIGLGALGFFACASAPHDELLSRADLATPDLVASGTGMRSSTDLGSSPDLASPDRGSNMLKLLGVGSRKIHGQAGSFDIALDTAQPLAGAISVEPRQIGMGHVLVFHFDAAITTTGTPSAVGSSGMPIGSVSAAASGNDVLVTLIDVQDVRRARVGLTGINGGVNAAVSVGFLVGDVDGSRGVNATDASLVTARSGMFVDATNFTDDVNVSGAINATDVAMVNANVGQTLP